MDWKNLIINIPDYPKAGINFKDITPLLADGAGFKAAIEEMAMICERQNALPDVLACPEARGFIFAAALAHRLGIGFIPLRKPHKLPREVVHINYGLEYGKDCLEVHKQDIKKGMRIMMVDDVLATGGTMHACMDLLQSLGAEIIGAMFLLELTALKGREKLGTAAVYSLIQD